MKLKLIIPMMIILTVLVACSTPTTSPEDVDEALPTDTESQLVVYGVAGNITERTENDDGTIVILVEGELGNNGADYARGYVTVNEDTVIYLNEEMPMEALEEGQYVHVFFEGDVMESDPIQATARQINIVPEAPENPDN
ncbi:MAG: YobA family protein [Vallitaleaceae bacterium]|nr:YobA family protein [Vallitaleaceae bacterium]